MRKSILTVFLLLFALTIKAQQKLAYTYDNSGNRESRTIVLANKSAAVINEESSSEFFEETVGDKQVKVYPNPVQSELILSVSGYGETVVGKYFLYRNDGALLMLQKLTSEKTTVDMSHLHSGFYVLRLVINGEESTWKIVKE